MIMIKKQKIKQNRKKTRLNNLWNKIKQNIVWIVRERVGKLYRKKYKRVKKELCEYKGL